MVTPSLLSFYRRAGGALLLAFGLLVLLLFSNRAHADESRDSPDAPGRISGRIINEAGEPLEYVNVELFAYPFIPSNPSFEFPPYNAPERNTFTDASGHYTFSLLTSGVYRIGALDSMRPNARQFYSNTNFLQATDITVMGNHVTGIDMVLHPGGAITGSLQFTLPFPNLYFETHFALYQKIADKWEYAGLVGGVNAIDPTGRVLSFQLERIAGGVYRLCAVARYNLGISARLTGCYGAATGGKPDLLDIVDQASDLTVTTGMTLTNINIPLQLVADAPIPSDTPGVSGRVTSPAGEPLPGVRVTAFLSAPYGLQEMASGTTNFSGEYWLFLPVTGKYVLRFSSEFGNYLPQYYNQIDDLSREDAQRATAIDWRINQRLRDINARLTAAGQITGVISAVDNSTPFYGGINIWQKVDESWSQIYVYPQINYNTGEYRLTGLRPGTYRLSVSIYINRIDFLHSYYGGTTLETASDIVIGLGEIRPNINIVLGAGQFEGTIRGIVTTGGVGRAGIRVDLERWYGGTASLYVFTDATGHYTMSGLLNGGYSVKFSDPAGVFASVYQNGKPLTSYANPPLLITGTTDYPNVNATLLQGGEISGTLRNYDGKVVSNANVEVYWRDADGQLAGALPYPGLRTDSAGGFRIKPVLPGVYNVIFHHLSLPRVTVPFGIFDTNTGAYIPTDLVVTSGATAIANMTAAAPSAGEETEEPVDRRKVYLPILLR